MIYLAAPYTHSDDAICAIRVEMVTYAAAVLTECGFHVYSPLTHGHQLAKKRNLPKEFDYWATQCKKYVGMCDSVVVLLLDGCLESVGVTAEVEEAAEQNKPVIYIEFGDVI